QLSEEPHVLDGDHGLGSEGLQQGYLTVGEEFGLSAAESDHSNRAPFVHQRHAEYGLPARSPRPLAALGKLVVLGLEVSKVDRLPVEHCSAYSASSNQQERRFSNGTRGGNRAMMGDEQETVAISAEDGGIERLAQARCAFRDRIEHRLQIRRRAR